MRKFALVGAGGYIAPRHMKAISDLGGELVAALDPNDSVGIIDSHAPDCHFFTEFEQFDDFLNSEGRDISYLSICSPNYLHEPHIKYGLRRGMTVICEKPLVLDVAALDRVLDVEKSSNGKVCSILQLRHHDAVVALKNKVSQSKGEMFDVDLTYITSRGRWYLKSWKGDNRKSGGVVMNIGIHFFDMLSFLFGDLQSHELYFRDEETASGFLQFKSARVRWFMSVNAAHLPASAVEKGQRTYRSISVNGDELEFSAGFTDLHTASYENVLAGKGFGLDIVRPSIILVDEIGRLDPVMPTDSAKKHGFLK